MGYFQVRYDSRVESGYLDRIGNILESALIVNRLFSLLLCGVVGNL